MFNGRELSCTDTLQSVSLFILQLHSTFATLLIKKDAGGHEQWRLHRCDLHGGRCRGHGLESCRSGPKRFLVDGPGLEYYLRRPTLHADGFPLHSGVGDGW